jgi:multisubunit Na+/H+ antiporter MnhE subunit
MSTPNAKDAQALVTTAAGWFFWIVNLVLGIIAACAVLAALLPLVGGRLPMVRPLGFTELAYAMGAYYLYRKA